VARSTTLLALVTMVGLGATACGGHETTTGTASNISQPAQRPGKSGAPCFRRVEHVQDFGFEEDPESPGAQVLVVHTDLAPGAYDDGAYVALKAQECFGDATAVEVDDANGDPMG
jgi:hypothetical protein